MNLERQNILLLSSSSDSKFSVYSAQSLKFLQLNEFLDSIDFSDCDKDEINISLLEGIELLLRAVKSVKISCPSKENLLKKLFKMKIKILTIRNPIKMVELNEFLNSCIDKRSIESFEEYFGIHAELDSLLSHKLVEHSTLYAFKDKVKLCLDLFKRGNKENISIELVKSIFNDLKNTKENELKLDCILLLLDLLGQLYDGQFELSPEYLLLIYQSNRLECLSNSRIFDKFLELMKKYSGNVKNSSVTMLNSKIRSFLGRPEAKNELVIQNCLKFVIEFQSLNIGCISQFGDFLLKCQFFNFSHLSLFTRNLFYKLLKHSREATLKFIEHLTSTEIKYEFAHEMVSSNHVDSFILSLFTDYFDVRYIAVLEKVLKKFIPIDVFNSSKDFDEFDDDLFIDLVQEAEGNEISLQSTLDDNLLTFFNGILLPAYTKQFKSFLKNSETEDLNTEQIPVIIASICYLLLTASTVSWTDLSSIYGPIAAASSAFNCKIRQVYCIFFITIMKLMQNSPSNNHSILMKSILNPLNAAEFWTRCLLDFKEYGQVEFFNIYYGYLLTDRLECFKIINAPSKFTFELLLKNVDFKSSQISSDWWFYLLSIGSFLTETSPNLHGVICALFSKYLPLNNFELIIKFYNFVWNGTTKFTWDEFKKNRKDLLLKHFDNNGTLCKIIKFIKSADYSILMFMVIYYEFMNGFMRNEHKGFLIRLALISVSSSIIRNHDYVTILSESLLRKTFIDNVNNMDNLDTFRNLFLLTELKMIPDNFEILFSGLCEQCELEYPVKFIKSIRKFIDNKTPSDMISELSSSPITQSILFKENILMPSHVPTALDCLCQLMKLFQVTLNDDCMKKDLEEFIGYVKKRKGTDNKYFNILFL